MRYSLNIFIALIFLLLFSGCQKDIEKEDKHSDLIFHHKLNSNYLYQNDILPKKTVLKWYDYHNDDFSFKTSLNRAKLEKYKKGTINRVNNSKHQYIFLEKKHYDIYYYLNYYSKVHFNDEELDKYLMFLDFLNDNDKNKKKINEEAGIDEFFNRSDRIRRQIIKRSKVKWNELGETIVLVALETANKYYMPSLAIHIYFPIENNSDIKKEEDELLHLYIQPQTQFWTEDEVKKCDQETFMCYKERFYDNPVLQGRINELIDRTFNNIILKINN